MTALYVCSPNTHEINEKSTDEINRKTIGDAPKLGNVMNLVCVWVN